MSRNSSARSGWRGIILSVIKGSHWREAFKVPSTSPKGLLDTPLRKLIRRHPDLAEEFLDNCYEREANQDDFDGEDVIKMNFDFIEDTHSYKYVKGKDKHDTSFARKDDLDHNDEKQDFKDYEVEIRNHPLMIMANERKVDLLQHPLCLAITLRKWNLYGRRFYIFQIVFYVLFLIALNLFILTSPSPIDSPDGHKCTQYFRDKQNNKTDEAEEPNKSPIANKFNDQNYSFRVILLLFNVIVMSL